MKLPTDYTKLSWKERILVREEYIKLQNSKCFYCKCDIFSDPPSTILNKYVSRKLFPAIFFNSPIHLQHDHETNLTEGAVHSYCNAVMWQYEGR